MRKKSRSLQRTIWGTMFLFVVLLCVFFGCLTYQIFNSSLYSSYEKRMADVLNYVDSHIDKDDLSKCVDTGARSAKYDHLVVFMDSIMEGFDIHYLYIVRPVTVGDRPGMLNILTADTAEGRKNDPDGYYLDYLIEDAYDLGELQRYQDAMENEGITYFKNISIWGYDYTAALPLSNSSGETFGLLCVDVEVSDIRQMVNTYTFLNIALIILLGLLFIKFSTAWINRSVSDPIKELEKSVVSFATVSHEQMNPEQMIYDEPDIHTNNEVERLSDAITQMTEDMRIYIKRIIDARGEVEVMKTQVTHMDMLAYQDALTHVKNRAWYDKTCTRLNEEILKGTAEFAIVMADLNNLKKVNDTYGHEHGNDYISGACHEICVIYDHSPVFRIGGDEFVVLLEKGDYYKRDQLFRQLNNVFAEFEADTSRSPWERYSASFGMSDFDPANDISVNEVFERADRMMYKNKNESRKGRE